MPAPMNLDKWSLSNLMASKRILGGPWLEGPSPHQREPGKVFGDFRPSAGSAGQSPKPRERPPADSAASHFRQWPQRLERECRELPDHKARPPCGTPPRRREFHPRIVEICPAGNAQTDISGSVPTLYRAPSPRLPLGRSDKEVGLAVPRPRDCPDVERRPVP